jgi:uncharacterized protein (TIGR00251 family)
VNGELSIRLQPRARRDEVVGERAGAIVIRVTSPPVDGKANAALCAFVARAAGVSPSRVEVVRGQTARDKVVRVHGASADAVRAALLARVSAHGHERQRAGRRAPHGQDAN